MDGSGQGVYSHHGRERSRSSLPNPALPAQLPRAPSRTSTNTSNTRASHNSNNSSSSNLANSVLKSSSSTHPYRTQQYHSRASITSERERPRSSRLSREATNAEHDPRLAVAVASSYLQEKLQRERRFESGRSSASRASSDAMSATAEVRGVQSSPIRSLTADERRPGSSGGDSAKRKAMGLMEMEQTITKLHKENFDLKFELYHRRERQTELESSLESLKTERSELEDMNDNLVQELEKRDKAIEEAVAMIVTLEATVERLQKDNDILRAVGADPYGRHSLDISELKTPRPEDALKSQQSHLEPGSRTLNRMPSFFSELSENTENLRNVYLENTGSLRRVSDQSRDDEMGNHKLMSAPSLSVLSESSFVSVYGLKNTPQSSSSPPPRFEPPSGQEPVSHLKRGVSPLMSTPRSNRRGSSSRKYPSGTFSSINDVLDASPLQKLQRSLQMDGEQSFLSDMGSASRGTPGSRTDSGPQQSALSPEQQRARQRLKQEKREALRKVMTDGPRDLSSNLPPTPDTISTSTLRRFKNSNDALPHQHPGGASLDRSFGASSDGSTSRSVSVETAAAEQDGRHVSQPPSNSAFHGRTGDARGAGSYFDPRQHVPARPRSADETTSSRGGRGQGWATDSSDEDFEDGASVSSTDCWMREGLKPNRRFPNNGAILARSDRKDTGSPDLFSFPAQAGGSGAWETRAMFGDLGGAGYFGSVPAPSANALDALGSSLPAPQAGMFGSGLASPGPNSSTVPPPPRRSSLHARTGSAQYDGPSSRPQSNRAAPPTKLRKSPMRSESHGRSSSVDVNSEQPPTPTLAATPTSAVPGEPSKRHYPPISGQQQAPRRSGGLQALFRRSIGGSSSDMTPPQPPASAPPPETGHKSPYAPPPQQNPSGGGPMVGVPSWARRGDLGTGGEELSSATPPPILRNPRMRRSTTAAELEGDRYDDYQGGAPLSPAFPSPGGGRRMSGANVAAVQSEEQQQPSPGGGGGGGRKRGWLGLGRVTNMRTRPG